MYVLLPSEWSCHKDYNCTSCSEDTQDDMVFCALSVFTLANFKDLRKYLQQLHIYFQIFMFNVISILPPMHYHLRQRPFWIMYSLSFFHFRSLQLAFKDINQFKSMVSQYYMYIKLKSVWKNVVEFDHALVQFFIKNSLYSADIELKMDGCSETIF